MAKTKTKSVKNGNAANGSNGNIFAHLSNDKQALIQDYVTNGWTVLQEPTTKKWEASKLFDGSKSPASFSGYESLDVLLSEMGNAESLYLDGEKATAEKDFNDVAVGLDVDYTSRLRTLLNNGWEFGFNKETGACSASKRFPEQKHVEVVDGFETVEQLIARVEDFELLESQDVSESISDDKTDDFDADEFSEIDVDDEQETNVRPTSKPTKRNLKVALTAREVADRTSSYFETLNQMEDAIARFKAVKDEHNANVKFLNAQSQRLRHAADSGFEYRDVPCVEHFDFDRHVVIVVRQDTYETVDSRPMTDKERQMPLPAMKEAA